MIMGRATRLQAVLFTPAVLSRCIVLLCFSVDEVAPNCTVRFLGEKKANFFIAMIFSSSNELCLHKDYVSDMCLLISITAQTRVCSDVKSPSIVALRKL